MALRSNIKAQLRGFYYATSGNDADKGNSIEVPKLTIQSAITAADALNPVPSSSALALVTAAQGGTFTTGFELSDFVQFNGQDTTLNVSQAIAVTMGSGHRMSILSVSNSLASGIVFNLTGSSNASIQSGRCGVTGAAGIGVNLAGTLTDVFVDILALEQSGGSGIGLNIISTHAEPLDVNIDTVGLEANNETFINHNTVLTTDRTILSVSSIDSGAFTGTTAFNVQNGILIVESAGDVDAAVAIIVKSGGTLILSVGEISGTITVESGGLLRLTAANIIGNVTINSGGIMTVSAQSHSSGSFTNNGTVTGNIGTTFYGTPTNASGIVNIQTPASGGTATLNFLDESAVNVGFIQYADTTGNMLFNPVGDLAFNTDHLYLDTSEGHVGVGTITPTAKVHINVTTATHTGFIIQANTATQTANLFEIQNSIGEVLASIDSKDNWGIGVAPDATTERFVIGSAYDVSKAAFISRSSFVAQETFTTDIQFNNDGTKLYMLGSTTPEKVYQYSLSSAYDPTSKTFINSFNISAQDNNPQGMVFNNDGTKWYMIGRQLDDVFEYDLSIAFDTNTSVLLQSFSATAQENTATDLAFNDDGTIMYVIGIGSTSVNQYALSTAFSVITASFTQSFNVGGQDNAPNDVDFNSTGSRMFILGGTTKTVFEYFLSVNYDVTTAVLVDSVDLKTLEIPLDDPRGMTFNDEGSNLFVLDVADDNIYRYDITGRDIQVLKSGAVSMGETLTVVKDVTFSESLSVATDIFRVDATNDRVGVRALSPAAFLSVGDSAATDNQFAVGHAYDVGKAVFNSVSFSVASEEVAPHGLKFNNDGSKMYVVGEFTDRIHEYALSTDFLVSSATFTDFLSIQPQDIDPHGLAFNTDGSKMFHCGGQNDSVYEYALGTNFDVSTGVFTQSFSVTSQDTTPNGVAFDTTGLKMYMVGSSSDSVHEYDLPTAFSLTDAVFFQSFSVSSETGDAGDIKFNSDGSRMYIADDISDRVLEYLLTEKFDISTSSFIQSFSVSAQETNFRSFAFNADGTKMYIVGQVNDTVFEYDMVGNDLQVSNAGITLIDDLSVIENNITLGNVSTPTDITADGGGFTLKGATDKTISWVNATNSWTFNQGIDLGTSTLICNDINSQAGGTLELFSDTDININTGSGLLDINTGTGDLELTTSSGRIRLQDAGTQLTLKAGTTSPEGVRTGDPGDVFFRKSTTTSGIYVHRGAVTGNTGWFDLVAEAGDVSKVGTPVDNQVTVWTGDGTIEGNIGLAFDSSTNTLAIRTAVSGGGFLNFNDSTDTTKAFLNFSSITDDITLAAANDIAITASQNVIINVDTSAGTVRLGNNILVAHNFTNQVIIGTSNSPDASAVLDVVSAGDDLGFLQPRMTTTQRDAISSPATGLSLYNTTTNTPDYFNGTSWIGAGVGDVIKVGTPVDNQLAVWTGDGTLEGDGDLTFDGSTLTLNGILDVALDIFLSTDGSSTGTPRILGFSDLSAGEAGRFQFGDAFNAIQNANGNAMDIIAFNSLRLFGNNGGAPPSFSTESNIGVQVVNTAVANPAFVISGASSQTADLFQLRNNSGTVLSLFDDLGNLVISGTLTVGIATLQTEALHVVGTGTANTGQIMAAFHNSANASRLTFRDEQSTGSVPPLFTSVTANGFGLATENVIGPILFLTGGIASSNERMRITSTGFVGIGTVAPATLLDVFSTAADTTAVFALQSTGSNGGTNLQFVGNRDPDGNVTGSGGDTYWRASAAESGSYENLATTTSTDWFKRSVLPSTIIEINTSGQFEALATAGVITISVATTIRMNITVSTTSVFVMSGGATLHLAGLSQSGVGINYTGTGTLLSGTGTIRIFNMDIIGTSSGTFLSLIGGTFNMDLAGVLFFGTLGTFSTGAFLVRKSNMISPTTGFTITNPGGISLIEIVNAGAPLAGPLFTINTNNPSAIMNASVVIATNTSTGSVFDFSTKIDNTLLTNIFRCRSIGGNIFKQSAVDDATIASVADGSIGAGTITAQADNGSDGTTHSSTTTYFEDEEIVITGTTSYNGTFQIFNVVAGVSFDTITTFVADDATGSVATVRLSITLNTGHGITAGNSLKIIKSNFYKGFQTALNVATNVLTVNGTFIATDIGMIERNVSLDETDPRINAQDSFDGKDSEVLAFGKTNGNITETTITDGVYAAINVATMEDQPTTQRLKLIEATNGIYQALISFEASIEANLSFLKTGSAQNYRLTFSINGAIPQFDAIASTAITSVADSSGTASFVHAGTTPPVGSLVTTTGFTTNTVYNIIDGKVTASTATTFEVDGITFGTTETGNYTVKAAGFQPAEVTTQTKSQTMEQILTFEEGDTFQVMAAGDSTTAAITFTDVSITAKG